MSDRKSTWAFCQGLPTGANNSEKDVLYAGTSDGVFRSADGGETWMRAGQGTQGAQIWSVLCHPSRPGWLFAGAGPCQIFCSEDDGEKWHRANIRRSGEVFALSEYSSGVDRLPRLSLSCFT